MKKLLLAVSLITSLTTAAFAADNSLTITFPDAHKFDNNSSFSYQISYKDSAGWQQYNSGDLHMSAIKSAANLSIDSSGSSMRINDIFAKKDGKTITDPRMVQITLQPSWGSSEAACTNTVVYMENPAVHLHDMTVTVSGDGWYCP